MQTQPNNKSDKFKWTCPKVFSLLLAATFLFLACNTSDDDGGTSTPSVKTSVAKPTAVVLDTAKDKVQLTFAEAVALRGTANSIGFTVKSGETGSETMNDVTAVAIKDGSSNKIVELTLTTSIAKDNSVLLSYATHATNYVSASASASTKLAAFTDEKVINEVDQVKLSYSNALFTESNVNDGRVVGRITVTLANDTFIGISGTPADGDVFTVDTHYGVANVPAGLTMLVARINNTTAEIIFTGNAAAHGTTNNVNNVSITWLPAALTTTTNMATLISGTSKTDIAIKYRDSAGEAASFTYVGTFSEGDANDGSVVGRITVTLANDTFVADVADNAAFTVDTHYGVANVPAGLTMLVTRKSATTAEITFTGKAGAHGTTNNVTNVSINWDPAALTTSDLTGVSSKAKDDIAITYDDSTVSFTYVGTFSESGANDGSVVGKITVTLADDTFVAGVANGNTFTAGTHYVADNVPNSLTMLVTRKTATTAEITFTGKADAHAAADDVNDVSINWNPAALTTLSDLTGVSGHAKDDIAITYRNSTVSFTYVGAFSEKGNNDGSVVGKTTVTLANDTFVAGVANGNTFTAGTHYVADNVPNSLTMLVTRINDTTAEIIFIGSADAHALSNNVNNVSINWNPAALTTLSDLTGVSSQAKSDMAINYVADVVTFTPTYSGNGNGFTESVSNDGVISAAITVTLANDTFVADVADDAAFTVDTHYTVANVPAGLTMVVTRINATTAEITFTGNAAAHAADDDVNNVSITWLPAAVTILVDLTEVASAVDADMKFVFIND